MTGIDREHRMAQGPLPTLLPYPLAHRLPLPTTTLTKILLVLVSTPHLEVLHTIVRAPVIRPYSGAREIGDMMINF